MRGSTQPDDSGCITCHVVGSDPKIDSANAHVHPLLDPSQMPAGLHNIHVNILSATLTTTRDRVAKTKFTFEMGDPKHLGAILKQVRQVPGVFDAYRVTQ